MTDVPETTTVALVIKFVVADASATAGCELVSSGRVLVGGMALKGL